MRKDRTCLSLGEKTFEAAIGADDPVDRPALLIAVATTPEERLRVARLLGQDVAVMMVASREEAVALLLGNDPPPAAPGRSRGGGPDAG